MEKNTNEYLVRIGKNLRKIRDAKGMSQQMLADLSNVDKSTILRIENGKYNPSILVLRKLAHTLNVNLNQIIE